MRHSLDYLGDEKVAPIGAARLDRFRENYPEAAARLRRRKIGDATVWSDAQTDHETNTHGWTRCRHLDLESGLCGVHSASPFTCCFELLKVRVRKGSSTTLTAQLFGRGWSYKRVDGGKGALCEMLPFTPDRYLDNIQLMKEMQEWAVALGEPVGAIPDAIAWLEANTSKVLNGALPAKKIVLREPSLFRSQYGFFDEAVIGETGPGPTPTIDLTVNGVREHKESTGKHSVWL